MLRILPAPSLPQMRDDGMITSVELSGENAIIVLIQKYNNAAINDSIRLYFDTAEVYFNNLAQVPDFPLRISVPASGMADKTYAVYYTVTDGANNNSTSQTVLAVLLRNGNALLEAPIFINAINGIINIDSVFSYAGTNIHVPAYDAITLGDKILLNFSIYSASRQFVSEYSYQHVITASDIFDGFIHRIPERYVLTTYRGTAIANYSVQRGVLSPEVSESATVSVSFGDAPLLLPPAFVDEDDGFLFESSTVDGIFVSFSYLGLVQGDNVEVFLRGAPQGGMPPISEEQKFHTITNTEVDANDVVVQFTRTVSDAVTLGPLDACYKRMLPGGGQQFSRFGSVEVDLVHTTALPAPVFTDEFIGVLDIDVVSGKGYTPLAVAYSPMVAGDILTLKLWGVYESGLPVNDATYISRNIVTSTQVTAGEVILDVPSQIPLSVGMLGNISALYDVEFIQGGKAFSDTTTALMDNETDPEAIIELNQINDNSNGEFTVTDLTLSSSMGVDECTFLAVLTITTVNNDIDDSPYLFDLVYNSSHLYMDMHYADISLVLDDARTLYVALQCQSLQSGFYSVVNSQSLDHIVALAQGRIPAYAESFNIEFLEVEPASDGSGNVSYFILAGTSGVITEQIPSLTITISFELIPVAKALSINFAGAQASIPRGAAGVHNITESDKLTCATTLIPTGHTESQSLMVTNGAAEWQQLFTLGNEPYID